jgi:hypothetical protein
MLSAGPVARMENTEIFRSMAFNPMAWQLLVVLGVVVLAVPLLLFSLVTPLS